ncbi:hypothetical protein J2Z23_004197 [Lederbergia galactosidilyticus]|uniref:hypothetical protein n=1 Tax=Lederbergia galactosidilytica TaxID=217031 RepID=UPI001AEAB520|nr:hypothetical protein [Lederbergia galactosidilytica]MBP1917212.1 hypothetical protein [Lederbergia galactosidilytica]
MPTIRELYEDAIKYEESTLAHYILLLLQEGKISTNDDDSVLERMPIDAEKLDQMIQSNYLGFSKIKIYSIKYAVNTFAFVYAGSPADAKLYFFSRTGKQPLNCHELSLDYMMAVGNRFINFRDWRKEQKQFPCIVGVYKKEY